MHKILDIWLAKFAFLQLGLQFVLAKSVKDLSQTSFVPFSIVVINEYIVKVNQNKIINVTRYYYIRKVLEGRLCIAQSKQKHGIFKWPILGDKSGLFTSIVSQLDLVITTSQVDRRQKVRLR